MTEQRKKRERLYPMTEMLTIKEAAEFLKAQDNILILSHANPDGDTLGCAFGLCLALQGMGKNAKNICADQISDRFDFMKKSLKEQDFTPEVFVTVDVADKKLLGDFEAQYGGKIDLAIDHHLSHVKFAKRLTIEPEVAACAQTVYKVIKEMGAEITPDIAACIYTGIATDSGCFKFSSVTPETHILTAELLKFDFGFDRINYTFFDMKTKQRVELEKKIYSDIEYYFDGRCAVVALSKELMATVDIEDGNGISAIPRQIEGVEVGVVFKEKKDCWKASLRSNSAVDVQKICSAFGGGGHVKAAGCSFKGISIEEAKKQLLSEVEKAL